MVEGVDGAAPSLDSRDEDRLLARIRKEAAQDEQARRPRWRWLQPALAAAALATVFLAVWIVRRLRCRPFLRVERARNDRWACGDATGRPAARHA